MTSYCIPKCQYIYKSEEERREGELTPRLLPSTAFTAAAGQGVGMGCTQPSGLREQPGHYWDKPKQVVLLVIVSTLNTQAGMAPHHLPGCAATWEKRCAQWDTNNGQVKWSTSAHVLRARVLIILMSKAHIREVSCRSFEYFQGQFSGPCGSLSLLLYQKPKTTHWNLINLL